MDKDKSGFDIAFCTHIISYGMVMVVMMVIIMSSWGIYLKTEFLKFNP